MLILFAALLAASPAPVSLSTEWQPENRTRLEAWLSQLPAQSGRRVAAFDWDNTMIKNDIGDAVFFHMLANNLFRSPAKWEKTSKHLTAEAAAELASSCGARNGFVQSATDAACADLLLAIYQDGKTPSRNAAWKSGYDPERFEPGYAWAVQLTQGYTPDEMRRIAYEVIRKALSAPVGTKQRVGTREVAAYVRIYDPMQQLTAEAIRAGAEVWIVSASGQYVVEAFASLVGVEAQRVIGIRPILDARGKITPGFQGCGTSPDASQEVITYKLGKRCWINKTIFHESDPQSMLAKASPLDLAAGDADTDIYMVRDAAIHVVINRNKRQITCAAVADVDGNWLLQPMFLEPVLLREDCSQ